MNEEPERNKHQSLPEKELQSEMAKQYSEEDSGWLKCGTDPRKTPSIFVLQELMIETRAWKKIRRLLECDKCRLNVQHRETAALFPLYIVTNYKSSNAKQ